MTRGAVPEFSENSYAILSQEYMLLSLRMGYHFSTIEALCTDVESKNYIRVQYKAGGAPLDRRSRRIKLLISLLAQMGFESSSQGDFLDAILTYQSSPALLSRLRQLGRISLMTKQLDMALSNDAIAQWYVEDLKKRLKWNEGGEGSP
jgi:pyruvate,water dikinase